MDCPCAEYSSLLLKHGFCPPVRTGLPCLTVSCLRPRIRLSRPGIGETGGLMKTRMSSDLIGDLVCLSGLTVSPDELLAAYMEHRSSRSDGKWYTGICVLELSSQTRIALFSGQGPFSVSSPRFSPDGIYLYFLTNLPGENQLARIRTQHILAALHAGHPVDLSTSEILTHVPHGITRYDLCASLLVFETPLWEDEIHTGRGLREMTDTEKAEFEWQRDWGPRDITELDYRDDGLYGIRNGSVPTLGTLDPVTLQARLIPNAFPLSNPALSSDGRKICCHGQPHTGSFFSAEELFVLNSDGSELQQLTEDHLLGEHPALFTGDNLSVIYSAWHMQNNAMALTLKMRTLSSPEPVDLLDFTHPHTPGFDGFPTCRIQHGKSCNMMHLKGSTLYFLCAMNGTENLYRIPLRASQVPQPVYTGPGSIHEFMPVHHSFLCLWGSDRSMAEICELSGEHIHPLASSNPLVASLDAGEVIHQRVPTRDGRAVIFSTVYRPVPFKEGRTYPAVLYLHDGPQKCLTQDFHPAFHVLAASGYAVICCDPRGSSGHGPAFCSRKTAWSDVPTRDAEDAIDAAVSLGFIDPNRLGIAGEGYGGSLTCKIIMRTNRFRAAVGQCVLVNQATAYGNGDTGFCSTQKSPDEVIIRDCLMQRSRASMIRDLDHIRTPLLLLHGSSDTRSAFEQSEQLFVGLHERHPEIPVRLVMFPCANHSISREGLLPHRVCLVQEMVNWFDRYLKHEEATV